MWFFKLDHVRTHIYWIIYYVSSYKIHPVCFIFLSNPHGFRLHRILFTCGLSKLAETLSRRGRVLHLLYYQSYIRVFAGSEATLNAMP